MVAAILIEKTSSQLVLPARSSPSYPILTIVGISEEPDSRNEADFGVSPGEIGLVKLLQSGSSLLQCRLGLMVLRSSIEVGAGRTALARMFKIVVFSGHCD